ncbi:MAG: methyltransferase domain-containing protein [Candidatus Saccharimonadales bacterium]
MYIAILGRQPVIGVAELERYFESDNVRWFSDTSATILSDDFDITKLGGTLKAGKVIAELPTGDWHKTSTKIVQEYLRIWAQFEGKITLGISTYGFDTSPYDIQKTGIILKQKLKKSGVSLRLIPNNDLALNSATSHHNKLGLSNNKVELLVVRSRGGRIIIAESTGAQNITAYTRRDQMRPKRDAFVGMLPPKLAQIMINLAKIHITDTTKRPRILDPFCGTGVVLQEAALIGYDTYGTDISEKMIQYSEVNLDWLKETHQVNPTITLKIDDAMTATWNSPIDAVICEGYLGQPFSAPPSPVKLDQVRKNCQHIMSTFLANISTQLQAGTPLCIAIPAWRDESGRFTHLQLTQAVEKYGFEHVKFAGLERSDLLYYRDDQIVARELLVLTKI